MYLYFYGYKNIYLLNTLASFLHLLNIVTYESYIENIIFP